MVELTLNQHAKERGREREREMERGGRKERERGEGEERERRNGEIGKGKLDKRDKEQ